MGLFGLFKPKNPLPPYEWEWLLASLKWIEQEFPKDGGQSGVGPIVLPTYHNFPESQLKGEAYAEVLFATVKALADMTDWPTVLSLSTASNRQRLSTRRCSVPMAGTMQQAHFRLQPTKMAKPLLR